MFLRDVLPPLEPPPSPPPPGPLPVPHAGQVNLPNSPLTVDLIQHASIWTWLAPTLSFTGSLLLFGAALWTLWRTNRAAYRRHREQLAADRNDRFRQEVADLLGERYATVDAAYRLADASAQHDDAVANGAPPADRVAKFLAVREKHTPQLNTVEHLAIRAALLTNNTELIAKLDQIRTASQGWKDLVDKDPVEVFIKMRDDLDTAFAELETLTRQLVTSDGVG